jgi:hypothetical protein
VYNHPAGLYLLVTRRVWAHFSKTATQVQAVAAILHTFLDWLVLALTQLGGNLKALLK